MPFNTRRRGTTRRNNTGGSNLRRRTNQLSREIHQNRIRRIRKNAQLVSVPAHSNGLKLSTSVRAGPFTLNSTTNSIALTMAQIQTAITTELGLVVGAAYRFAFIINAANFYGVVQDVGGGSAASLVVQPSLYSTGLIEQFEDFSTNSGICSISIIYPQNNLPNGFGGSTFATISSAIPLLTGTTMTVYIDVMVDVTQTPVAPISFRSSLETSNDLPKDSIKTTLSDLVGSLRV